MGRRSSSPELLVMLAKAGAKPDTNIVSLLLKAGANPNPKDAKSKTPLDRVFSVLRSDRTKESDRRLYETLRKQLVDAGADYVSTRGDAITLLHKDSGYKWPVLLRENQRYSEFTLLELISHAFPHKDMPAYFHFSDLSEIRLHRPTDGAYEVTVHDIDSLLSDAKAPAVNLKWGDVLEFNTAPHRVGAQWDFPFELRNKLAEHTARKVTLHYGEEPEIHALPALHSQPFADAAPEGQILVSSCWLTDVLKGGGFLSIHDLSRIVVQRKGVNWGRTAMVV